MGKLGAIEAVVKAMREHEAVGRIQEQGAATLAMLANIPENKGQLFSCEAVDLILTAMSNHRTTPPTLAMCAAAVWNLSSGTPDHKREVVRRGGLDAVLRAMVEHPEDANVQDMCVGAMWTILASQEQYDELMSPKALQTVRSADKRFPKSKFLTFGIQSLTRTVHPAVTKAIELKRCVLAFAPRCTKPCDARRNCFCYTCNVVGPIFCCVTCNGPLSFLRYCSFCFQACGHDGHEYIELFAPGSCSCLQTECKQPPLQSSPSLPPSPV
jgi:hypothetical protein